MNKRDVILVAVGAVAGYLLVGFLNKKSKKDNTEEEGSAESEVSQVVIDKCNEAVANMVKTSKFANNADLESAKVALYNDCVAKSK